MHGRCEVEPDMDTCHHDARLDLQTNAGSTFDLPEIREWF